MNNFWTLNREQIRVIAEEFCEIEEDENNRDCDREPVIKQKLRDRIKELNPEQQSILNKIRWILGSSNAEQAFEIIHGPGGVGKSFLAKIIIDSINLVNDTDPLLLKNHVLVAAPTGVAAKAIAGRTLHNAFSLPIEKFGLGKYVPLKGKI